MAIEGNGGGYNKERNVVGTWDLTNYGLRKPPITLPSIDNYHYPVNPKRRTDNVPQVTIKTTNEFDKNIGNPATGENIGIRQDVIPTITIRPNAMKSYFIPVKSPELIPKDIPIHNYHFVFNRDTTDPNLMLGINTMPPTLEYLKNEL